MKNHDEILVSSKEWISWVPWQETKERVATKTQEEMILRKDKEEKNNAW